MCRTSPEIFVEFEIRQTVVVYIYKLELGSQIIPNLRERYPNNSTTKYKWGKFNVH
jgi:hypothetical protein